MSQVARAVANLILDRCDELQRPLTNLSLQKLVFLCHVWFLQKSGRKLIKQPFEAWRYGPVMPHLYREFKPFGEKPIHARATRLDFANGSRMAVMHGFKPEEKDLLISVIDAYSKLSASQLVELTHVPGGPWYRAWHSKKDFNPGLQISDCDIEIFYGLKRNASSLQ